MKLKIISSLLRRFAAYGRRNNSGQDLQDCLVGAARDDGGNACAANPDRKGGAANPDRKGGAANPDRNDTGADSDSLRFDRTPRSEELGERICADDGVRDAFSPVPVKSRFERRLELAKLPRCRKHKVRGKKAGVCSRAKTHLGALLEDLLSDERVFGWDCTRQFFPVRYSDARESGAEVVAKAGVAIAAAAAMDAGESVIHQLQAKKNSAEHEARLSARRKYYEAERARRAEESAAVRAAVPPPSNRMPTAAELLEAYARRHESEAAKLRFGRLMIDLDEHVRYDVVRDGERIVGNTGGVRDWLEVNCPELAKHYHTCQRFKRKVQEDPLLAECCD